MDMQAYSKHWNWDLSLQSIRLYMILDPLLVTEKFFNCFGIHQVFDKQKDNYGMRKFKIAFEGVGRNLKTITKDGSLQSIHPLTSMVSINSVWLRSIEAQRAVTSENLLFHWAQIKRVQVIKLSRLCLTGLLEVALYPQAKSHTLIISSHVSQKPPKKTVNFYFKAIPLLLDNLGQDLRIDREYWPRQSRP